MKHIPKTVVLLVFGGQSPEHHVSIASASNVYQAIDKSIYDVVPCYIDEQGAWWSTEGVTPKPQKLAPLIPQIGRSMVMIGDTEYQIDVLFPMLHGQYGEDGSIQGLARMMHLPIVGCDVDASVVCMDKVFTKKLLGSEGIPVVPYIAYNRGTAIPQFAAVQKKLGSAVFVKPARLGSSIGVSKATSEDEFLKALTTAVHYDDKILIESALEVREIEVAVLGTMLNPQASAAGEIIPDRDFYTFDSKYDENSTSKVQIPAQLSDDTASCIRKYALTAFSTLNCRGLARIDFFVDAKNKVYLNEINTMPGFTNISMYPKSWEAEGKSYSALLAELIELAKA